MQLLRQLQVESLLELTVKSPEQCEVASMQRAVQRGLQLAEAAQANVGNRKPPTQNGTVTIAMVGSTVVYSMQTSCTEQNEVFCARDNEDNRLVFFVDGGSEVTLIAASAVSREW